MSLCRKPCPCYRKPDVMAMTPARSVQRQLRPARWRHAAFGAAIDSAIELPLLARGPDGCAADIVISLGAVAPDDVAAPDLRRRTIRGLFRYECRRGAKAVIELAPGADPAGVADMITSRVLTILAYQRGLLPLHAAAVRAGGGLVAIAGPSGAGKSTLAAALVARGLPLAADDMVVVRAEDPMLASGGACRLKLSPASLAEVGWPASGGPLANDTEGKYLVAPPTPAPRGPAWLPLRAVVHLSTGEAAAASPLSPLAAAARAADMIRSPELIGSEADPWARWLALCSRTPFVSLTVPRRLASLPRLADQVLALLDQGL